MFYFDHAATTPVDPRVLQKMLPYFTENFGNPNSQHACGRRAGAAKGDDCYRALGRCDRLSADPRGEHSCHGRAELYPVFVFPVLTRSYFLCSFAIPARWFCCSAGF